jgi:uncharacterized paraquat-inducible protein A
MSMNRFCPGSIGIREPKPEYELCQRCGYEVEIWTDELKARCPRCRTLLLKGREASCIDWCQYARECIGEEAYARLMADKPEAKTG